MDGELLRADRPLRYDADCCRAWQQRIGDCRACRDACPAGALLWTGATLALHGDCLGCGRCVPACPMGALTLDGFETETDRADKSAQLSLECQRVPAALRQGPALPCLGAIDEASLIGWVAQHEGVTLIDRGWCAACPAGGTPFPVAPLLEQMEAIWDAFALPAARRPQIVSRPLPERVAKPLVNAKAAAKPLSRRQFFRQLVAPPAPSTSALKGRPFSTPAAHVSLAKTRRDQALRLLNEALDYQAELPAPALEATDSCRNHQGCRATCPTGAIDRWEEEGASGITFDASRCIGCGLCVAHCPEKALQLLWHKRPIAADSPAQRLTHHQLVSCRRCGVPFACSSPPDDDKEVLCPECEKEKEMARELFRELFVSIPS